MLTPQEKRWIRKMVREEFQTILKEALASTSEQLGGYDGATAFVDPDEYEGKARRIGFHATYRKAGDPLK